MSLSERTKHFSHLFELDLGMLKPVAPKKEWDEDCFLVDKWSFMDEVYPSKMYRIDDFPRPIRIEDRHEQLELYYYDERGLSESYFEKEKMFSSVLSKLWCYSVAYVESSIGDCTSFPKGYENDERFEDVKQLFAQESIVQVDDWEMLKFMFIVSFRNFSSLCVYFIDLKTILWIGDCSSVAYICDEEQVEFVRMICMTEGVYLRK